MLKFGLISQVDIPNGLARVYFEEDDFVSAPLKMAVSRSMTDKVMFPFEINEHVYCLMDENLEYGVICGAIYDEKNLPNSGAGAGILSFHFGDSSSILYDRNSHTLSLDIKGKVNIKCTEANIESTGKVNVSATEIDLTATTTKVSGILEVSGAATINGVVSMGGISGISGSPVNGSSAELSISKLTASNDVVASGKSLKTHTHTSAASGSPTSPPL